LQLAAWIGRPDAPLLLDARRTPTFEQSPWLLAGARHCAPENIAALAGSGAPRSVVVYCAYGHGVSRGAAQTLQEAGWDARWLAGGIEGGEPGVDDPQAVAGWRAAGLPRIRKQPELGIDGGRASRWITRARPKIDRIACPWLIRRFIDPEAEFFYVPEPEVFVTAERLGAVPFDIEGAPVSHEWERCSFDALLRRFELRSPALDTMAQIVRGADTSRLEIAPQAAGLLAISLGMSRLLHDDREMLEATMPIYDALFEWCRAGRGESHSWRAHAGATAAP
jgi:rhodanese-related sulfurtransferase